jgi:hypothetical protein
VFAKIGEVKLDEAMRRLQDVGIRIARDPQVLKSFRTRLMHLHVPIRQENAPGLFLFEKAENCGVGSAATLNIFCCSAANALAERASMHIYWALTVPKIVQSNFGLAPPSLPNGRF